MKSTEQASSTRTAQAPGWVLARVGSFPRLRVLAWQDDVLYASRNYTLLRARMSQPQIAWEIVGHFRPAWWRNGSVMARLTFRLFREGFHALAVLPSGHLVGVVPGAIIASAPGEAEFRISHKVLRGTRPLHITATPGGRLFWGEYFDNARRDEVHIYASEDQGSSWDVAYTFARGAIRHVHNIVYDEWADCLWILTGDNGTECRILRASSDFKHVDEVLSGNQQARAAALVPTQDSLYFSSDTPLEANHIYRMDRAGNLTELAGLSSSSIYGCAVGDAIFFSTMVEPSEVNPEPNVCLCGSRDGFQWHRVLEWKKDVWPMRLFQYGNAFLPDGKNTSALLAVTTVAVKKSDLETTVWRV